MKILASCLLSLFLCICSGFWPSHAALVENSPKVAVSITPFYALVAALMEGVATPTLIVPPGASPHQYTLRPSDIQKLIQADLIFWGGPTLESFLVKPLDTLPSPQKIIQLDQTPQLLLLPLRQDPAWEAHEHLHPHANAKHVHYDMHFWLDPNNAIILSNAMAQYLIKADPTHTEIYEKNNKNLKIRLKDLDARLAKKLASVQKMPYIVFHDAYQYFERHYHLNAIGSITLHPELPPSAQRLMSIRTMITNAKARCVFTEPQFQPKLVQNIIEDLPIKVGELDPIGQAAEDNPRGYFRLLEKLAAAISSCLQEK